MPACAPYIDLDLAAYCERGLAFAHTSYMASLWSQILFPGRQT